MHGRIAFFLMALVSSFRGEVQSTPTVGFATVEPVSDQSLVQDLVRTLEADPYVTVLQVETGVLDCASLSSAEGAPQLQFRIKSNQTVLASKASYKVMDGTIFTDGKSRKIWMGNVVTSSATVSATPTTISMTWTDDCDTKVFLIKMVSPNSDGTMSIVKSVPWTGEDSKLHVVEITQRPRKEYRRMNDAIVPPQLKYKP